MTDEEFARTERATYLLIAQVMASVLAALDCLDAADQRLAAMETILKELENEYRGKARP